MQELSTELTNHFTHGYNTTEHLGDIYKNRSFERVVIIGVGGSALGGALLSTMINEISTAVDVMLHRTYGLPRESMYQNALIILISYSGNTEEVLNAYQEATHKNLPTIVMTSGGLLREYAQKDTIPLFLLPQGIKPRFSLMYQFGALIALLENTGIIHSQSHIIEDIQHNNYTTLEKDAQHAVMHIGQKTPLIYSSPQYQHLAYIIKIQLNENAKIHAFSNVFPETNHNEIMGHTTDQNAKNYRSILLRSKNDDPRIRQQQDIFIELLKEHQNPVHSIDITGRTYYNTIFQTVLLGHLISFYLAKQRSINPYQTTAIDECKKRIHQKNLNTTVKNTISS